MRVSAWRRASIQSAAILLSFGCVLAGVGGCNHASPNAPVGAGTGDEITMGADKQKAIMDADAMISTGDIDIEKGQSLKDTDADRSAKLIKQGEDEKARGEAMRDQAYSMK